MVTTYRNWQTGDVIRICASIDEFCGAEHKFVYAEDVNVTKYPEICSIAYGEERGCGLHLNNVELTFKLVKISGSVAEKSCAPQQIYKIIGSARTNSNGVAVVVYTVTEQDRLDYVGADGLYKVMVCITNSDGQSTVATNISRITDTITINQNLCYGVSCTKPICYLGTLYESKCDDITGICVADLTKPIISPCPTHMIEYNLSFLPSSFLGYVSTYIVDIINNISRYLTPIMPAGVTYKSMTYSSQYKIFRIFVNYTLSAGSVKGLYIDIPQAISDLAALISGILMFILGAIIVAAVPGYGLIIGPVVAVAGTFVMQWSITNLQTNVEDTGTRPDIADSDKIRIVQEYALLLAQKCGELHPGCCGFPCVPTCSAIDMSSYNKCMGANQIAEYTWDHGINDNFVQSEYDSKKNQILDDSSCLQNGTCTPAQVAENIGDREKERVDDSNNQVNIATEREELENCFIKSPLGGCLLSKNTAKNAAIFGGFVLGAYLLYNAYKPEKSAKVEIVGGK